MEIKTYRSNFGKALLLSWFRSLFVMFLAFLFCIIFMIVRKSFLEGFLLLMGIGAAAFLIDFIVRWKTVVLQGDELIVKRLLRPRRRIRIDDTLVKARIKGRYIFTLNIYTLPKVRLIDPQGMITDIYCSFMTEATARLLEKDIMYNAGMYGGRGY